MKKAIISLLLLLMLLLTSCGAGLSDWTYKLPNGYEVWYTNSKNVNVQRVVDGDNNTVIPSFVKEFS